jgi:hypothetical protein
MKTEKRCLLLTTDHREAFYYGDDCITWSEGQFDRFRLLELAERFDFVASDLVTASPTSRDEKLFDSYYGPPQKLSDLQDQYY